MSLLVLRRGASDRPSYPFPALGTVGNVAADRTPLPVEAIDLASLVLARNDTHPDGDWWFDPRTGESLYHGVDDDADLPALVAGVHVVVPREPQPESDVEEFFEEAEERGVAEETAVDLYRLARGRGGARRFRDRVVESDAAPAWTRFTWEREAARAVAWLRSRSLVDEASAADYLRRLADPTATFDGVPPRGPQT